MGPPCPPHGRGEGGDNRFRTEFFAELRRLADRHEALLIFDGHTIAARAALQAEQAVTQPAS